MMWGDETGNDADIAVVKPDVIIFLKVPANVARAWVKKEPANSLHSEAEHEYLTKTSYEGTFLDYHEKACQEFMDTTDIPHHDMGVGQECDPSRSSSGGLQDFDDGNLC